MIIASPSSPTLSPEWKPRWSVTMIILKKHQRSPMWLPQSKSTMLYSTFQFFNGKDLMCKFSGLWSPLAGDPVCLFLFKFESSMLASWRSLPSYSNPDYVVNNDIRHWWNHWLLVSDNQRHWLQHFTLLMMMAMMMMATMMMATMPRPKLEVYRHFLDWKTNTVSSPADVTAWWWWWWFFMFQWTKRN